MTSGKELVEHQEDCLGCQALEEAKEKIEKKCRERYLKIDDVICEKGDICKTCEDNIQTISDLQLECYQNGN